MILTDRQRELRASVEKKCIRPVPQNELDMIAIELDRWETAENWLRENGSTLYLKDDRGVVKRVQTAPQLEIARRSYENARNIMRKYGIEW